MNEYFLEKEKWRMNLHTVRVILTILTGTFSMNKSYLGGIVIFLSIIPLGFLIYTLKNLRKLGIPIHHPRVLVKLILFIILLTVGTILFRM